MATFLPKPEFSRLQNLYTTQVLLKESITTTSALGTVAPEFEPGKKDDGYNFYPTPVTNRKKKRKRKAPNKRPAKDLKSANWAGAIMRRPLSSGGF